MIGILTGVFILFVVTEFFLTSSGFTIRENKFNCLVDYLTENNVTDDYFPSSSELNIENANCSEVLKQFDVFEDVKEDLCSPYNVTVKLCKKISKDKEKKLCTLSSDAEARVNQSTSSSNETCVDAKKYFSEDELAQNITLEELYARSKENCRSLDDCFSCIKANLTQSDDYENTMLHAIAVNFTIIEFEVWNYFMITSSVQQLVNEADTMLRDAIDDCQLKQDCVIMPDKRKAEN